MTRLCRLRSVWLLAGAILFTPVSTALGRYVRPDLDRIPVEQIVKNLNMLVTRNPKDATLRLNLARAHAMAYALKSDVLEINKKNGLPWFGYAPKQVPFTAKPTADPAKRRAAEEQLRQAIRNYQAALSLAPDNLTAQLGLAWCLEQAGKKDEAVQAYRRVVENGWKREKDLKTAGLGWHSVTAEAAGYLTPLLDRTKDAEEIKTLTDAPNRCKKSGGR